MAALARARKVLIWTENYWIGGADRFLVDLLRGLHGADGQFVLAGNPHAAFDRWLAARLPWLGPRTTVPIATLAVNPLHRFDRRLGRDPTAIRTAPAYGEPHQDPLPARAAIASLRYGQAALNLGRLRRLLVAQAPDTLLINNGGYPGGESCRMASLAAGQVGVPRIVHFVHNMAHAPAWPAVLERRLDRRIDHAVTTWVTAAGRASHALSSERGIPSDHIETVHYGISVPTFWPTPPDEAALRRELGFEPGAPALAVVANLEPRKGIAVLLEALARLRASGTELPTAVIGDGPLRNPLRRQITALGLERCVRLLGWREDVDQILEQATLLALPSLANECLPLVILEAMAHRLPVVSTDVAGIPEMVLDGETGRVVAPGDVAALADALGQVAADPAQAAVMGERGHARVGALFSRERMVAAMSFLLGVG
jgi:glycosyltransferase involved in cell wall biosynthesis